MRIILLGAPASGKGTQAKLICGDFNIPHISTGDILRSNIIQGTALGIQAEDFIKKGKFVPDNIIISIIEERLDKEDCNGGFVLDGFPRNITQAESLDEILEKKGQHIDRTLFIDVPECIITERVKGRQVCKSCGAIFHSKFNPTQIEDKCDICEDILIKREDDNEEIINNRVEEYINSIEPILNYYGDGGPLLVINGYNEIKDIHNTVNKALKAI